MADPVTLDINDPFDRAVIPLVLTNRRKRQDYAKDGDPFSNFRETAQVFGLDGFGPTESALFNVLQKVTRLRSLRANGRMAETSNETVDDTYLDLAVYAIILYGLSLEEADAAQAEATGFWTAPTTLTSGAVGAGSPHVVDWSALDTQTVPDEALDPIAEEYDPEQQLRYHLAEKHGFPAAMLDASTGGKLTWAHAVEHALPERQNHSEAWLGPWL